MSYYTTFVNFSWIQKCNKGKVHRNQPSDRKDSTRVKITSRSSFLQRLKCVYIRAFFTAPNCYILPIKVKYFDIKLLIFCCQCAKTVCWLYKLESKNLKRFAVLRQNVLRFWALFTENMENMEKILLVIIILSSTVVHAIQYKRSNCVKVLAIV